MDRNREFYYRMIRLGRCVKCAKKMKDSDTRYCRECLDKLLDKKVFNEYKKGLLEKKAA